MAEYKSIYTGEQIDNALGKAITSLQQETDPIFNASASATITSQDIANWNGKSDFSGDYDDLSNKPTLFSGSYNDLSDKPELFSGDYDDLTNKPSIPSATSELTNDSGFIDNSTENLTNYYKKSETYSKTEVDNKISSVYKYKGTVSTYQDLPSQDLVVGDVYNVESDGSNYAWIGTAWDKLGGDIDLSGYQELIDSSNKLDANLVDDTNSSNKFVTSAEKTIWNNKSDFSGSYNDLTNKPTLFSGNYNDLTNKPTIPDELSDLTDDSTHRLVTDTEKTTWNGKQDLLTAGDNITITNNVISASSGASDVYIINSNAGFTNWNGYNSVTPSDTVEYNKWETFLDFVFECRANDKPYPILMYQRNYNSDISMSNNYGQCVIFTVYRVGNTETILYGSPIYNYAEYNTIVPKIVITYNNATSHTISKIEGLTQIQIANAQATVFKGTNDTITGKKTFSTLPESSVVPTTNNQLVNKKYVDDQVGAINTVLASLTTPSGNGGN